MSWNLSRTLNQLEYELNEKTQYIASDDNGTIFEKNVSADKFIINGQSGQPGYLLSDGSIVATSQAGQPNIYLYNNNTNNSSIEPIPGAGQIRTNNLDNQLTTIIYINHLTSDNIDIDIFLSQISILSVIYMQDKNNALNYVRFNVIAPPTVFTNSYYSIPVVYATGAGSGTTDLGDTAIFMSIFDNSSLVDSRLSAVETKTQGQTATSSLTTFIHPMSMNSNKITNLASASNATDAVNKFYVDESISNYLLIDDAVSTYLALSGGTITGNLYSTCTDATTINYK